jgi:hypothetical protein
MQPSRGVTLSYAGEADTGWINDLTIERLELVVEGDLHRVGADRSPAARVEPSPSTRCGCAFEAR